MTTASDDELVVSFTTYRPFLIHKKQTKNLKITAVRSRLLKAANYYSDTTISETVSVATCSL